jgi:hypothetical protein
MNEYNFIIQFIEFYGKGKEASIELTDGRTVLSPSTYVERAFTCKAPSYELARVIALEFAQKTVREFYEPLGVWAAYRICIG